MTVIELLENELKRVRKINYKLISRPKGSVKEKDLDRYKKEMEENNAYESDLTQSLITLKSKSYAKPYDYVRGNLDQRFMSADTYGRPIWEMSSETPEPEPYNGRGTFTGMGMQTPTPEYEIEDRPSDRPTIRAPRYTFQWTNPFEDVSHPIPTERVPMSDVTFNRITEILSDDGEATDERNS